MLVLISAVVVNTFFDINKSSVLVVDLQDLKEVLPILLDHPEESLLDVE